MTADIILSVVYTLFYGLLIAWLFQRAFKPDSKMQKWNVISVAAWLFDLLENVEVMSMLAIYLSRSTFMVWLTVIIGSLIELPSAEEMEQSIENIRRWKGENIKFENARSCAVSTRSQQYIDILLMELEVSPYRKLPNVFAEIFS